MNIVISGNTRNIVKVAPQQNGYLGLITPGPQGPAFAGQQFFDIEAMEGLTVADSGATVRWNGTQFAPSSELSGGLSINGGAF